jgi:hypothetical protein
LCPLLFPFLPPIVIDGRKNVTQLSKKEENKTIPSLLGARQAVQNVKARHSEVSICDLLHFNTQLSVVCSLDAWMDGRMERDLIY